MAGGYCLRPKHLARSRDIIAAMVKGRMPM
jgi:hypothetical protein